jgi:isocitrate dehydrogenase kinase/phosphatase
MGKHRKAVAEAAELIYEGFLAYNRSFARITDRARRRFEQRDWKGHQKDIADRVDRYERSVREQVAALQKMLGPRVSDRALWNDLRWYYGQRIENVPDAGFMKTFFNSITRRIFGTVGIDPQLEFVSPSPDEGFSGVEPLILKRYPFWGSLPDVFAKVLRDFAFKVPHRDPAADAGRIASELEQHARIYLQDYGEFQRFEFIDSVFFQSARAYLVGRILQQHQVSPIVIALENTDDGIRVDAVLLSEEEVSIVFSYTRSYYFADPNSVVGAVRFLHSILPRKPIDELYTVLGRLRQGKTERFRTFTSHMNATDELLMHAEGDRGLVMIVFTLPSYDLVFKVIRDRFGFPKTISRNDVIEKYKMVSKHDRAGRLIDTQEFLNLEFPADRFAPELRDELLCDAAMTARLHGGMLTINHVYIERRVRPLNLYIREVNRPEALAAILDYGQAIRDLAHTNIFPGDLLLKNFGVTRHRRVVFYDYDEVSLVTDCNFRDMPEPEHDEDALRAETWYYVATNDIFPEEFIRFLSMDKALREAFLEVHGELLTAAYWRRIREAHLNGEIALVVPYQKPVLPVKQRRPRLRA